MSAPAAFSCVVDASVAAQSFIPEPLTPLATGLFSLLATDPATVFRVPDLFFPECANIFWKFCRRGGCSDAQALGALASINALRLERTPAADVAVDALVLALAHDISAYDACYVALAARHSVTLITADDKLANKLANTSLSVTKLANYAAKPSGS